jgi:hypothetical protein
MNLIKGKNHLNKENEGGEKTDSSDKEFVIVEKKAVQKTNSSNNYFEENKPATSKDDFEKLNRLMKTRMSTLKKL